MHLLSRGLFAEEARRTEKMLRADFTWLFLKVVASAVVLRIALFWLDKS